MNWFAQGLEKDGWLLSTRFLKGLSETRVLAMRAKTTSTCEDFGLLSSCGPQAAV